MFKNVTKLYNAVCIAQKRIKTDNIKKKNNNKNIKKLDYKKLNENVKK